MNNVNIFRAKRGEGKTKWLVERAFEEYTQGFTPIYIGLSKDFDIIRDVWRATIGTVCPIKDIAQCKRISFQESCFFTDGLIESALDVSFWSKDILARGCKWYITMSKEDFVN
jgi:hypothetical protein